MCQSFSLHLDVDLHPIKMKEKLMVEIDFADIIICHGKIN